MASVFMSDHQILGDKSLPLCSYPTYPKHQSGPATDAASYRCAQP